MKLSTAYHTYGNVCGWGRRGEIADRGGSEAEAEAWSTTNDGEISRRPLRPRGWGATASGSSLLLSDDDPASTRCHASIQVPSRGQHTSSYSWYGVLRKAEPIDSRKLLDLSEKSGLSPWTSEMIETFFEREGSDFRVLEIASPPDLAGFYLSLLLCPEMELLRIAVSSEQQRRGWGQLLLDTCLATGRRAGCRRCLLEVRDTNQNAIRFYLRNDFRIIALRKSYYVRPPGDAFVMKKEL